RALLAARRSRHFAAAVRDCRHAARPAGAGLCRRGRRRLCAGGLAARPPRGPRREIGLMESRSAAHPALERYRSAERDHERCYADLHEHVLALALAKLLVVVDEPINKDTEMHPLVRWQYRGGIPEPERKA